jgi:hypothetical protein
MIKPTRGLWHFCYSERLLSHQEQCAAKSPELDAECDAGHRPEDNRVQEEAMIVAASCGRQKAIVGSVRCVI